MTPWGEVLGAEGVDQVVAYVQQLSGQPADAAQAAAGATHFQTYCMACHGVDGKGMTAVGAPNLTDGVWLYGGDADTIRETVVKGRMGQMPAFADKLGEQRVRLLAAYVLRMSGVANSEERCRCSVTNTPARCDGPASGRTWPSSPGRRSWWRASRR